MTPAALLLPLFLAAAPAGKGPAIPDKWDAALQAGLPAGQVLAQKLAGDLDGDGKPEWVAIGEPKAEPGQVSIAIFAAPKAGGAPTLRFAQWLKVERATRAGATIRRVKPVGNVVVLVAAAPEPGGDSAFLANAYAWIKDRGDFRPMIPEELQFRSQGGFAIEDFEPATPGDEFVAWTYLPEEGEQLYDHHRYAWKVWRYDGLRWSSDVREKQSADKFADPAAAAKAIGLKTGDVRKTIPGIAAIP